MSGEAPAIPVRMRVYATAIPMRGFEHAAAAREVAEAVVARVDFQDGAVGWGETLPRAYVTGETIESVVEDLESVFWPAIAGRATGPEDIARIAAEPCRSGIPARQASADGAGQSGKYARPTRLRQAAGCAVELTLFGNGDWLHFMAAEEKRGQAPFSEQRKRSQSPFSRVSGVLGSSDPARTARRLRLMRWYGLRDFKLKLGISPEVDAENLRIVRRKLHRAIGAGKCTLRADVNSAWPAEAVPDRVAELAEYGVCVVEQPADVTAGEMVELSRKCRLPLMADESLITPQDASTLLEEPRIWWNVRISKNGGLGPALELCRLAAERGVSFVCGAMVGESGILSAAQRRLLEVAPPPRFVEGNYGRFLLCDDLTRPSPRFGYGGRLRRLGGAGLGVEVDEDKVARYGKLVKTLGV